MRSLLLIPLFLAACSPSSVHSEEPPPSPEAIAAGIAPSSVQGEHEVALLAGGCFWCVESAYDDLPGVISAESGYAGGPELAPTYKQVSYGKTGHAEVVRVVYDPKVLTFERVLEIFWHNIDPFQKNAQFCDRGTQYRSAIFALDARQKAHASKTKEELGRKFGRTIATEINAGAVFWRAEEYHQDFHVKEPAHYQRYRRGCGRDARLQEIWGDEAGH
jgi:peptide-methionine (S)-S-oxide reductase